MESERHTVKVQRYSSSELKQLPAPVQRYFKAVLKEGQPIILVADINHAGTFNMSETGEQWKPFSSVQRVITDRPGFDWDARIYIMPGLALRVHDSYIVGEGILHASLFGLVSVVNMRGTPEMAEGELMRFFAEASWYPTVLLPSQGVKWEAVDNNSARASMTDGQNKLTLLFRFNRKGLIESIRAEARGRTVNGRTIPTPWEGRWIKYEIHDGINIPVEGEVAWVLPEGPKPYWRGRITEIAYEFAE